MAFLVTAFVLLLRSTDERFFLGDTEDDFELFVDLLCDDDDDDDDDDDGVVVVVDVDDDDLLFSVPESREITTMPVLTTCLLPEICFRSVDSPKQSGTTF